jgi:hypothetical protein
VQAVALVTVHDNIELLPLGTVLGFAAIFTVGDGWVTETVADCAPVPPEPLQLSVKVAFAVSAPVGDEPLTALAPDQAPEAVQDVALVADHDNVEPLPLATVLGLAVMLTVGAGCATDTVADCTALPPAPLQVNV